MPAIIKRYRNEAGLSQQQLADSAGISKGFISSIERGKSAVSIDVLVLLAEALNVPADTLIKELVQEAYAYEAARQPLGKDNRS